MITAFISGAPTVDDSTIRPSHSLNQLLPYNMLMYRKNQQKTYIIETHQSTSFCKETTASPACTFHFSLRLPSITQYATMSNIKIYIKAQRIEKLMPLFIFFAKICTLIRHNDLFIWLIFPELQHVVWQKLIQRMGNEFIIALF